MLKSFIKSLTDYINNNRQDIRTTLKYSTILTAGIMAMFAFHPALMSIWAYIAAGFDTMLQGFTFAIESTAHVIYEAAAMLWAGIAKVAAYLYASMVALLTVGGEWATAFQQFLSLPLLEIADKTINALGYFWTTTLVFILSVILVATFKNPVWFGIVLTVYMFKKTTKMLSETILKKEPLNTYTHDEINNLWKAFPGHEVLENLEKGQINRNINDFSESELSRTPDGVNKYKTKTSK